MLTCAMLLCCVQALQIDWLHRYHRRWTPPLKQMGTTVRALPSTCDVAILPCVIYALAWPLKLIACMRVSVAVPCSDRSRDITTVSVASALVQAHGAPPPPPPEEKVVSYRR